MKRLIILLGVIFLSLPNLMAEEFVAKRATYEKDGHQVELSDLSACPSFHADYFPKENIITIQCSAGRLILKQGVFFYGYSGRHKGLKVTARAYVEHGEIDQIAYEEYDELSNTKVTIYYYKK